MPSQRSEVTEIVTGLAMLGYVDLERALEIRPGHISHVGPEVFDRLEQALGDEKYADDFRRAWDNGTIFARSDQALRGRPPWLLEWKGPHRPVSRSIETIPADLRVDHVYLVSCKYGSEVLHNSGPSQLFDHCLAHPPRQARSPRQTHSPRQARSVDWYDEVASDAYRRVWEPVHRAAGLGSQAPNALSSEDRKRVKASLRDAPLDVNSDNYQEFVSAVSAGSAQRWRLNLADDVSQREMFWRLIRLQAAPYFLLGARKDGEPLRYRISTPWDVGRRYRFDGLEVQAGNRGQPSVNWAAHVTDLESGAATCTSGYVEVRWSHGKLQGSPEAKIHLSSHPYDVPGYEPLEPVPGPSSAAATQQPLWGTTALAEPNSSTLAR